MLRHHSEGIEVACQVFGQAIEIKVRCPDCQTPGTVLACQRCHGSGYVPKMIPVRWIGEQHMVEDFGKVPAAIDWIRALKAEPWMNRPLKLSRELDKEVPIAAG